jgi:hypothetical protein
MLPTLSALVFAPLQCPGVFPLRALANARVGVAQGRQEGNGLCRDQASHQLCNVEIGVACIQRGNLHELGVTLHHVGRPTGGVDLRRLIGAGNPERLRLQARASGQSRSAACSRSAHLGEFQRRL